MRFLKDLFVILIAVIAVIYLVNPTAGVFELIPDIVPFVGNLDEAGATLLLLNSFAYFGWDITKILGARTKQPDQS